MTDAGPRAGWSAEELMAVAISREVRDGETAAVGTLAPVPAAGVLLAHLSHAPRATVFIFNHEDYWPFRQGSKEFYDYAQRGNFDLFFLSGGQIDRHGNLNLITLGEHDHPRLRFPGGAGSAMLYYMARRVILFRMDHTPRIFVERVDTCASPGSSPPDVVRPGGPWKAVTPLCVFRFDQARRGRPRGKSSTSFGGACGSRSPRATRASPRRSSPRHSAARPEPAHRRRLGAPTTPRSRPA